MTDQAATDMVFDLFAVLLGGWLLTYGCIVITDFFTDVSR